jgi:hypothetical protein
VEAARLSTSLCSLDTFCSLEDDAPILAASKQQLRFLFSLKIKWILSLSVWFPRKFSETLSPSRFMI